MAFLSPRAGDFVWETTNTAGTFNAFTLLGPVTVGAFTYSKVSDIYADGETVYYVRSQAVIAGTRAIFESGRGTYNHAANTITPTVGSMSSNMAAGSSTFVPITWGAGTQNVVCVPDAASLVTVETIVAVLTTLTTGDVASIVTAWKLQGVSGLTGGSDGRAVRYSGSNTVTNAKKTDTNDQLAELLFLKGGIYFKSGELVTGLSSLTTGQIAFLGDDSTPIVWKAIGDPLPVGVTPSSTVRCVRIGQAMSATTFLFEPQQPIGGV